MAEYSISDLARAANTTVRNVRAYQNKRLIPAPRKEGRVSVYSDVHLARLRLIGRLLERGYTLTNIGEMVDALDRGAGVPELLGLEEALTSSWSNELPSHVTLGELVEMFGLENITPAIVERAVEIDLVRRDGTRFIAPSLRILQVGAELVRDGVPLPVLLDQIEALRGDASTIANRFVRLIAEHIFDVVSPQGFPPPEEGERLAEIVRRVRPMARTVVDAELARALEQGIRAELGDRIESMFAKPSEE
jgi:DNA-binding transcriptional MerR regulator